MDIESNIESNKPIDIMLGTKVQYNKRHLMTSAFLTLTKDQGHTTRSKVTDVEVSAFSKCFLFIIIILFFFQHIAKVVTSLEKGTDDKTNEPENERKSTNVSIKSKYSNVPIVTVTPPNDMDIEKTNSIASNVLSSSSSKNIVKS